MDTAADKKATCVHHYMNIEHLMFTHEFISTDLNAWGTNIDAAKSPLATLTAPVSFQYTILCIPTTHCRLAKRYLYNNTNTNFNPHNEFKFRDQRAADFHSTVIQCICTSPRCAPQI